MTTMHAMIAPPVFSRPRPPLPAHRTARMLRSARILRALTICFLALSCLLGAAATAAEPPARQDYLLGEGDAIRIQVFQNPDLALETRVSETGSITYPLIGAIRVGGLSIAAAEQAIARALKDVGFVQ